MSACRRFEDEGLLRLEQGLPLDDHFATCPDCRAERAVYERLRGEIAAAGDGLEPPLGWQTRLWAAVEKRKAAHRRPRGWWLLLPVPGCRGPPRRPAPSLGLDRRSRLRRAPGLP